MSRMVYNDWTPEDFQRLQTLNLKRKLVALSMVRKGDRIDARVMVAREVFKERSWRIDGIRVTPAMCAEYDCEHHRNVRQFVEAQNGEPLA